MQNNSFSNMESFLLCGQDKPASSHKESFIELLNKPNQYQPQNKNCYQNLYL